jgi:hypothetical protein
LSDKPLPNRFKSSRHADVSILKKKKKKKLPLLLGFFPAQPIFQVSTARCSNVIFQNFEKKLL